MRPAGKDKATSRSKSCGHGCVLRVYPVRETSEGGVNQNIGHLSLPCFCKSLERRSYADGFWIPRILAPAIRGAVVWLSNTRSEPNMKRLVSPWPTPPASQSQGTQPTIWGPIRCSVFRVLQAMRRPPFFLNIEWGWGGGLFGEGATH